MHLKELRSLHDLLWEGQQTGLAQSMMITLDGPYIPSDAMALSLAGEGRSRQ